MEADQDPRAPRFSLFFRVCLRHLTLGSFSRFCAQTVHSGGMHNAAKPQTFQRVTVGQAGGPDKGACEGREYKHYTTE